MCCNQAKLSLAMTSTSVLGHARHHPLFPQIAAHITIPATRSTLSLPEYLACITLKLLQLADIIIPTNRALLSPHPNNLASINTPHMRIGALPACVASHNASGKMYATRLSVCMSVCRCAGLAYASTNSSLGYAHQPPACLPRWTNHRVKLCKFSSHHRQNGG